MRFPDWLERLEAEVVAAREREMAYGSHDCLQFAARCVLAMTGEDFRTRFPPYDSPMKARSILDANGGVAGILVRCLGEPIPPTWAEAGDVVVARFRLSDGRPALEDDPDGEDGAGICLGTRTVFCGRPGGLSARTREVVHLAFRVA